MPLTTRRVNFDADTQQLLEVVLTDALFIAQSLPSFLHDENFIRQSLQDFITEALLIGERNKKVLISGALGNMRQALQIKSSQSRVARGAYVSKRSKQSSA